MTKILVIDDEKVLLEELCDNLMFAGFDVLSTFDSMLGVQLAQQHLPDLILCDVMMPKLDGYGVLLELRSHPQTATIPFIFLTAKASREDLRKGMRMGADDYLTKPFQQSELLETIDTQLNKRALRVQEYDSELNNLHQALAQEQEMRLLKSRFVSMASHEFRNPLTTILSSNTLLRDYADRMPPERRLIHMERIESAVNQMLYMLDDMLVIGRVETGTLSLEKSEFSLVDLANTIADELRQMMNGSHNLNFECYYDSMVYADEKLVRYILVNLLSNALKYSPEGGDVVLRLARTGDDIVLQVEDHGIGIPKDDQQFIFDAFRRAANVGAIQGTGLGLAIVKLAVELHKGTISLDSRENVGTLFTVKMPICSRGK
jgi:two-component system, sensor histidine kinase and response regulator